MIKKSMLAVVFVIFSLALTGCDLLNSDLRLFGETFKNMEETRNYEMDVTVRFKLNGVGQDVTTNIKYDFESDEVGKMQMNVLGQELYFDVNDDNMTAYYQQGSSWFKSNISKAELEELGGGTIESGDYSFLNADDIEYKVIEEEDGFVVYEFSLTDSSVFTDSIEGIEEMLPLLNITKADFDKMMNDLTYLVTIDKETKLITKMELDMTEMFTSLLENALEGTNQQVTVDIFKLTIDFKNYNNVNISITDAMKNGTLTDDISPIFQ